MPIWFLFLCIWAAAAFRTDSGRTAPLIVGHRGNDKYFPENTMASFRGALEAGADGFETDLWLTKDGYIVLCHDNSLDRTTNCTGKIADRTLDYIKTCDAGSKFSPKFAGEPVPLFEDAIAFARENDLFVIMDLKQDKLGKYIAPILTAYSMQGRAIASCRSDTECSEDIQHYLPNITVKQRLAAPPLVWSDNYFAERVGEGFSGFSFELRFYEGPAFVRAAHRHLMSLFSWTLDKADEWERCVRDGHDGIITDDPAGLVAYVTQLRARMFPSGDNMDAALEAALETAPARANRDSRRTSPMLIAHRGYSTVYPENTMAAFRAAIENGADGFETDLWTTKDNVIVLCHDPSLNRTTNCTGMIADHTYEEIRYCDAGAKFSPKFAGERLPTFEEAVKFAKSKDAFIIMDLKEEGLGKLIGEILRTHQVEALMVASCRSDAEVGDIAEYVPYSIRQRLDEPPPVYDELTFEHYMQLGVHGYSYDFTSHLVPDFVKHAHEHLQFVASWTVNDAQTMLRALHDGHDAVLTDDVGLLTKVVEEVRSRVWP